MSSPDPRGFILKNTKVERPPLLPEIELHLASEVVPLWHMTHSLSQLQQKMNV